MSRYEICDDFRRLTEVGARNYESQKHGVNEGPFQESNLESAGRWSRDLKPLRPSFKQTDRLNLEPKTTSKTTCLNSPMLLSLSTPFVFVLFTRDCHLIRMQNLEEKNQKKAESYQEKKNPNRFSLPDEPSLSCSLSLA